ncbi:unnamed protein product [Adineta steineri]|uniref:Uncharacterized protein n=1 Tax=Adineta steineri TaxID=433720 RepID=A0A818WBY9_9BILA|nr:unnamed protein product [Adineta steineri]
MTLQHGLQQHTVLVTQHFGPQQQQSQQQGSQQEQQQGSQQHGSQHEPHPQPQPQPHPHPQPHPQPHPHPQPGILICVKATSKCGGYSQDYCYDHLGDHRQALNVQLDHIGNNYNHFRQLFNKYINNSQIHAFIQQKANECRELLKKHINENIHHIEVNLNKQTDQ